MVPGFMEWTGDGEAGERGGGGVSDWEEVDCWQGV